MYNIFIIIFILSKNFSPNAIILQMVSNQPQLNIFSRDISKLGLFFY